MPDTTGTNDSEKTSRKELCILRNPITAKEYFSVSDLSLGRREGMSKQLMASFKHLENRDNVAKLRDKCVAVFKFRQFRKNCW